MNLFNEVDKLYDKYLKVWEDVCNSESPTDFKEGVDRVGDYFVKMADDLGFKVEKYPQEVSGDVVVITLNPNINNASKTILVKHPQTIIVAESFGFPSPLIR